MKTRIISLTLLLLLAGSAQASVADKVDLVAKNVVTPVELVDDTVMVKDDVKVNTVDVLMVRSFVSQPVTSVPVKVSHVDEAVERVDAV